MSVSSISAGALYSFALLGDDLLLPSGTATKICVLFHFFSLAYPIAQRFKWGFLFWRRAKRPTHTPTSQHASYTALANVSAALFEGKESVWDSETSLLARESSCYPSAKN
jgi:hypothetical protein